MEATLRCLEAPMQSLAAPVPDNGRACAQQTPAQGSAAARPSNALVSPYRPIGLQRDLSGQCTMLQLGGA